MNAITVQPLRANTARLEDIPEADVRNGSVLVEVSPSACAAPTSKSWKGNTAGRRRAKRASYSGTNLLAVSWIRGPRRTLKSGELGVAIVRRPDPVPCANCAVGEWDMCRNGQCTERGI
jgi:glucose 1-dehydrogenase